MRYAIIGLAGRTQQRSRRAAVTFYVGLGSSPADRQRLYRSKTFMRYYLSRTAKPIDSSRPPYANGAASSFTKPASAASTSLLHG